MKCDYSSSENKSGWETNLKKNRFFKPRMTIPNCRIKDIMIHSTEQKL